MRHQNITYPKKILRELFLKLPLPDLSFSDLILENYPIPIVFMWIERHYPPRTPGLAELFFITFTRFESEKSSRP